MCGILGFITDKPNEENYKRVGDLLYVSSERGTDATGIAIVEGSETKVVKEDLPSDKFIKKYYEGLRDKVSDANIVLGHTRLATQGHQRDNHNNHPIVGPKHILVHNGTCSSMDRIKDYEYKGTVDSEILLSHVEVKGLKEGLKSLRGSAAVAIISADEPTSVYLWRHNNPLWLAYNEEKKTIFFASTEDILLEGLSDLLDFFSSFKMRQLPEDTLYKITYNPLTIQVLGEVEPTTTVYWGSSRRKSGGAASGWNNYPCGSYGYGYGSGYEEDYEYMNSAATKTTPLNSDVPKDSGTKKEKKKYASFYTDIMACKWDGIRKIFTTESLPSPSTTTRYYFDGPSQDFEHWKRLEGGGHVSLDKKMYKCFDHDRKSHFVMTINDAIREGLIDLSR